MLNRQKRPSTASSPFTYPEQLETVFGGLDLHMVPTVEKSRKRSRLHVSQTVEKALQSTKTVVIDFSIQRKNLRISIA